MGHVPPGPVRLLGSGRDLQGRQHRRAPREGAVAIAGARQAGRQAAGRQGEAQAAAWYEAHGYEVVARNWRCQAGEIDLIVQRHREVVFCEVKSRRSDAFGSPAESVTPRKQAQVRRVARVWLAGAPPRGFDLRFDVAAVLDGRLEVLEAAF